MAEDVSDTDQPTVVYIAHSADCHGNGSWQIFRPAYKSIPDFEGEKLPKIFRPVGGNIRYFIFALSVLVYYKPVRLPYLNKDVSVYFVSHGFLCYLQSETTTFNTVHS